MRRIATFALSASLTLASAVPLLAQDAKNAPKAETAPAPKSSAADAPIPKDVQDKLDAARKAVAEAIIAAQDAGLVQTTIDPPPILDILLTGRATDEATLKNKDGASPEVFGAWFTGQGKAETKLDATKDVRITRPTKGLQSLFDLRKEILGKALADARKAKDAAAAAKKMTDDAAAAAKKMTEEKAKAEAEKKAADEKAEAEKKAADEKAKAEAEVKKAEETKKTADAEAKAKDDAEAKAKDDAAKAEEAKKAADAEAEAAKPADEAKPAPDDTPKA